MICESEFKRVYYLIPRMQVKKGDRENVCAGTNYRDFRLEIKL